MSETKKGHIDQRLTDVSIAYKNAEFVGGYLFPEKPVVKGADEFTVYKKGNAFQVVDDKMAKFGEASELQIATTTDTYSVKPYALKGFVAQEDIDNADDPLSPEADETEALTNAILLNREIRCATLAATNSNTAAASAKWDTANGDPVSDIEKACAAMFQRPNTIVISQPVWNAMKFNAKLLAYFGGGSQNLKMATAEMISALFGIQNVVIGGARKSGTKMPKDPSLSYVWGAGCYLGYVVAPALKQPTFGCLFSQKINGGSTFQVRKWFEEDRGVGGTSVVQVEHLSVEKIIAEDFGYYISACV